MMGVVLSIGGHTLSVHGTDIVRLVSSAAAFRPFMHDGAESQWEVRYGCSLPLDRSLPLLYRSDFPDGVGTIVFYASADVCRYEVIPPSSDVPAVVLRYMVGSSLVEASHCNDPMALRFSLWLAYGLLSAGSGAAFVHSSVAVYRGRAVLFLGESGTGKSTHTRLWLKNVPGSCLLNDDSPVLSVPAGGEVPLVYGSPWSGKADCYCADCYPLAAAVRLSQAPANRMRRLPIPEAFAALQPSLSPSLMQDERFADRLIDIISATIASVPVYHLECLPDDMAALMSFRTIFGNEIQ